MLAFLLAYPWFATPFFTYQIGAQALALGLIALSLTFLGGYGGMISLAQMTVAGIAGYMVAIFGTAATDGVTLGWPWWLAVLIGIVIAVAVAATFIGWLSVRTEGIYTIMITLAIGVAFYYLACRTTPCSTASRASRRCSRRRSPASTGATPRRSTTSRSSGRSRATSS